MTTAMMMICECDDYLLMKPVSRIPKPSQTREESRGEVKKERQSPRGREDKKSEITFTLSRGIGQL